MQFQLNYKLMLPWLLFHGMIFGLFAHIAVYMTASSLLMDFKIFALLLASFTMIISRKLKHLLEYFLVLF